MLNPGDIILVRGDGRLVDDAIQLGETILYKKPYAQCYVHCAIYLGGNTVAEAQGGRISGSSNIGDYAGLYDIGHIQMTYDQRVQFVKAAQSEYKLPYDWVGIGVIALRILSFGLINIQRQEDDERYCSRFIEWAAKQVGITLDGYTPESLALDSIVTIEKGCSIA